MTPKLLNTTIFHHNNSIAEMCTCQTMCNIKCSFIFCDILEFGMFGVQIVLPDTKIESNNIA